MPWLISICAHLVSLLAMALFLLPSSGQLPTAGIDISLGGPSGPGASGAPRQGGQAKAEGLVPRTSRAAVVPAAGKARVPAPAVPLYSRTLRDVHADEASTAPEKGTPPDPGASQTAFADSPSVSGGAESASGESPSVSSGAESGSGGAVVWKGLPRRLIRKRNPEFPAVLSAIGQEVELEARWTVAPSGIVTRVEITKSSGYIEADASVEAALRDYLYSPVEGGADSAGTTTFSFRLEKPY